MCVLFLRYDPKALDEHTARFLLFSIVALVSFTIDVHTLSKFLLSRIMLVVDAIIVLLLRVRISGVVL